MEIIRNQKGGVKICLNGYAYTLHKECNDCVRWRCSKYNAFKCRSILKTTLDLSLVLEEPIHRHSSDAEELKVLKCVEGMKRRAKDSLAKPVQIFAEAVASLPEETRARMPVEDSAKRTLRNQRSREHPQEPVNLCDLRIKGKCLWILFLLLL